MASDQKSRDKQQRDNDVTVPVPRVLILFLVLTISLAALGVVYVDHIPSATTNQLLVVVTALYTFLTGAYVYMTTLQWVAMRESLRFTRESAALTQRAWIALEWLDKNGTWFVKNGPDNWIDMIVKNLGRLPATQVSLSCATVVRQSISDISWPIPIGDDAEQLSGQGVVIGIEQERKFAVRTQPLTDAQLMQIRNGRLVFGVAIRLTYTDAVRSQGVTSINAMYEPREQAWVFAPEGNSVD